MFTDKDFPIKGSKVKKKLNECALKRKKENIRHYLRIQGMFSLYNSYLHVLWSFVALPWTAFVASRGCTRCILQE
jgi:hypothetical protein